MKFIFFSILSFFTGIVSLSAELKSALLKSDIEFFKIIQDSKSLLPLHYATEDAEESENISLETFGELEISGNKSRINLYKKVSSKLLPNEKIDVIKSIIPKNTEIQFKTEEDISLRVKVNGTLVKDIFSFVKVDMDGITLFGLSRKNDITKASFNIAVQDKAEITDSIVKLLLHEKDTFLFYYVFCPESRDYECLIVAQRGNRWIYNGDGTIWNRNILARSRRDAHEPSRRLWNNFDSPQGIYLVRGSLFSSNKIDKNGAHYSDDFGYTPRLVINALPIDLTNIDVKLKQGNEEVAFAILRDSILPSSIMDKYWLWEAYFAVFSSKRFNFRIHETGREPNYPVNKPKYRTTSGCLATGTVKDGTMFDILNILFIEDVLNKHSVIDSEGYVENNGFHLEDTSEPVFLIVADLPFEKSIELDDLF